MRIMKRFLTGLCLCCTLSGFAATEVDGIWYNFSDSTAEVTYQNRGKETPEYTGNVVIPGTVSNNGTDYAVMSIGERAFYDCSNLVSLHVPSSVTSIASDAFIDCDGLTEITLPFVGTSPESTGGVTFLTMFANNPALKKVTISEPCTTIPAYGFSSLPLALTEINLPNTITTIGHSAFAHCRELTSITIPEKVDSIGEYTFAYCDKLTSVIIPENVKSIGNFAFYNSYKLTSIDIPKNVTAIGKWAFGSCDSDSSSVTTSINVDSENANYSSEDGVLFNKDKTTLIRCPGGIAGNYTVPGSVTTIEDGAFTCCSTLTSVTIPPSVTTIESSAFANCINLASIDIPQSVIKAGSEAFERTKWMEDQPDGVIYIGKALYKYKGKMPENTTVKILEGTTSIGISAFDNCSNLVSISIPRSVSTIENAAFSGCRSLASIICSNPVPVSVSPGVFRDVDKSACTLRIPAGSMAAYQEADVWKDFNIVEISLNHLPDSCVVINGVAWATRNVDLPGTFADSESAGKFYQWNRTTAWSTTDPLTGSNGETTWDITYPDSVWNKEYDPSPEGYRVPTFDEIQRLVDYQKVSTEEIIQNGVKGVKFIDNFTGNSIFLPVIGTRSTDGSFTDSYSSRYRLHRLCFLCK